MTTMKDLLNDFANDILSIDKNEENMQRDELIEKFIEDVREPLLKFLDPR